MITKGFAGKKVKVKTLHGTLDGVWKFNPRREYELLYSVQDGLHVIDDRGLGLLLSVKPGCKKDVIFAAGVEDFFEIDVIKDKVIKVIPVGEVDRPYEWTFTRGMEYEIKYDEYGKYGEYVTDDKHYNFYLILDDKSCNLFLIFDDKNGIWYAPGYEHYKFKEVE